MLVLLKPWREVASVNVSRDDELTFCESINVWITRPNVVNKRLTHATVTARIQCEEEMQVNHVLKCLQERTDCASSENEGSSKYLLTIRRLVPKEITEDTEELVEVIVEDRESKSYTFIPVSNSASDVKLLQLSAYKITLKLTANSDKACLQLLLPVTDLPRISDKKLCPSVKWLTEELLPKLASWMGARSKELGASKSQWRPPLPNSLINEDQYGRLYRHLKGKYGRRIAQIWPEVTDPGKFVYEDVAIATYLLILWESERESLQLTSKQSFVDLGCGNGLLVHILSQEGHPGYGIDLKRRKIWEMYEPNTVLKETPIIPTEHQAFAGIDWVIGNHSDELTPWIPLLAARSSYKTRYFVLPCCFHDFNQKFSRQSADVPQYQCYLEFVEMVGQRCGFNVQHDRLRIPSTKNICLIGQSRTYPVEREEEVEKAREQLIEERCGLGTGFVPRPALQAVRNCTKLNRDVAVDIVKTLATTLLQQSDKLGHQCNSTSAAVSQCSSTAEWRRGGQLSVTEAATLFEPKTLAHLKHEYGGLKTLLRNYPQVFQVTKGVVCLRNWAIDEPVRRRKQLRKGDRNRKCFKVQLCWFHENHPDGCPRKSSDCSYAHGNSDLSVSN
ncbi:probable tRNA (uracil-O(2)-)-methyltransferase [Corticium candelabrum]|uniref:probable tRNA (uracil-O(2)-)-methyltransferase n=1 Tax=Corticium candelabrum TaxID=121492 RepID=UPI002E272104|nr:probable tRNA (uracil-O(2)-)-methyltransferase [Corticium candelabrum]